MFGWATLDSFRIGAGALLFISAITLAQGRPGEARPDAGQDPSVVPLAIPILVGPAVAGTILVMSAECQTLVQKAAGFSALIFASVCIGAILYSAVAIERKLGREVLAVLMKLTGLILAAFAAQIIFTGIRHMLAPG